MAGHRPRLDDLRRLVPLLVVFTVLLTAGFVGVLSLATGRATGVASRIPYYFLVLAAGFLVAIVVLSRYDSDGRATILGAVGISVFSFVLVGLAAEGVVYSIRNPSAVFGSQLVVYFVAAALIGTGLGYWVLSFWRQWVAQNVEREADVPA